MSIDIKEGDILVVGSREYPIRSCGEYAAFGTSATFRAMATVTASTKRKPAAVGIIKGAPVTNLASVSITPLDPVDQELAAKQGIGSAHEVLQTFAADSDGYVHLMLEDPKNP